MPGLTVLRPAHANETAAAWRWTMAHAEGPVALVLSRQNLQVFESEGIGIDEGVSRGAYIVAEATDGNCDLILLASGSELGLAMDARETLQAEGIRTRVVSMPSFELFSAQDAAYREAILPAAVSARVSIEAGVTLGWERWVGSSGATVGVDRFGASAPGDEVMLEVGLSADQLVKAAKRVLAD